MNHLWSYPAALALFLSLVFNLSVSNPASAEVPIEAEKKAWLRVQSQLIGKLAALKVFPIDKKTPFKNDMDLDARFWYGTANPPIKITRPSLHYDWAKRAQFPNGIIKGTLQAKVNPGTIDIEFVHLGENWPRAEQRVAQFSPNKRESFRFRQLKNRLKRENIPVSRKAIAKTKQYGPYPGNMYIEYRTGKTGKLEQLEVTKRKNPSLRDIAIGTVVDFPSPQPDKIIAYFEFELQPHFHFGMAIRAKAGQYQLSHSLTEVPLISEQLVDRIANMVAGLLTKELGSLVATPTGHVSIFDANPLFTNGVIIDADTPVEELIEQATTGRQGAVADGESRLLIRASYDAPGTVDFQMLGFADGTLRAVNGGKAQPHTESEGEIARTHYAFALYTPPHEFNSGGQECAFFKDQDIASRQVTVQIQFTPFGTAKASPAISTQTYCLVRPPVVLMHGTYSTPTKTWGNGYVDGEGETRRDSVKKLAKGTVKNPKRALKGLKDSTAALKGSLEVVVDVAGEIVGDDNDKVKALKKVKANVGKLDAALDGAVQAMTAIGKIAAVAIATGAGYGEIVAAGKAAFKIYKIASATKKYYDQQKANGGSGRVEETALVKSEGGTAEKSDLDKTLEKIKKIKALSEKLKVIKEKVKSAAKEVKGIIRKEREAALEEINSLQSMAEALDDQKFDVFMVDYQKTNGLLTGLPGLRKDNSHFEDNRMILWDDSPSSKNGEAHGIKAALQHYRDPEGANLAITQVDVVGHSMGGVLPRVYASDLTADDDRYPQNTFLPAKARRGYRRPDNFNAGDINRLITLCSTHYGSDLSHLMYLLRSHDLKDKNINLLQRIKKGGFNFMLKYWEGLVSGAAADQIPESPALKAIGKTEVPAHAVACVARVPDMKHFDEEYLKTNRQVMRIFFDSPGLLREVFTLKSQEEEAKTLLGTVESITWVEDSWLVGEETEVDTVRIPEDQEPVYSNNFRLAVFGNTRNDATVRVQSQWGGLTGAYRSTIEGLVHGYAPLYPAIQKKVIDLLNGPPSNFSPKGFPPAGEPLLNRPPNIRPMKEERWEAIRRSNIVPIHAEAISKVARDEKKIIIIRNVNPDSTPLIAGGASTKHMHVKGKSSDWGLQRGLIAVDQAFSKLAAQGEERIREYNCEVLSTMKSQGAYRKTLKVTIAGRSYSLRKMKKKVPGRKKPLVFLRDDETGEYWEPTDRTTAPTTRALMASDANTEPLEVLTDTTKNEVMTADYDFLAIGTFFNPGKLPDQFDPQMGAVYDYQKTLIKKINEAVKATGYPAGGVVHHGPENQFLKSPGVDYPNTAFEPDGSIVTLEEGPEGKEAMWLKRYFRRKIEEGWFLTPNPRWNWEGRGTPYYRKFTVIRGWPDVEFPIHDKKSDDHDELEGKPAKPSGKSCDPLIPCDEKFDRNLGCQQTGATNP